MWSVPGFLEFSKDAIGIASSSPKGREEVERLGPCNNPSLALLPVYLMFAQ